MISVLCALAMSGNDGLNEKVLAAIGPRMEEFVRQQKVAGTVTLIAHKGKIVHFEAHGYANYNTVPMQKDTLFGIASMTKPVTAVAIMMLVEEGRLSLRDTVDKILPEFGELTVGTAKAKGKPTIQQLLCHTAGFSSDVDISDEKRASITLKEFVSMVAKQPLKRDPGSGYEYSGPGFAVAGRIVEVVSGQSFQDFLKSRLFDPLGMKNTSFFPTRAELGKLAGLYSIEGGRLKAIAPEIDPSTAKFAGPAGGLYSTAEDMWAFFQCLANKGHFKGQRILSPASIEAMSQVQTGSYATDSGFPADYGLGVSITRQPPRSLTLNSIGSFGHAGALGTQGWVDPKRKTVGIFMAQLFGPADALNAFMSMASASVEE